MVELIEIRFDRLSSFQSTDKAWHVSSGANQRTRSENSAFLPKSLCHVDKEKRVAKVPKWLADKKNLIERLDKNVCTHD